MKHLPNILSLLRIPLAFAYFQPHVEIRFAALIAAMATDWFDGYFARRNHCSSRLGTSLDPLCDKFFVACALFVFYIEGAISIPEILCMGSRDIALLLFGSYLILAKRFRQFTFQAIWSGKLATALQLFILLALTLQWHVPAFLYTLLVLLGLSALIELLLIDRNYLPKAKPPESQ